MRGLLLPPPKRINKLLDIQDSYIQYPYEELMVSTKNFSEEGLLGIGGAAKMYKGTLRGTDVALKRFHKDYDQGRREFQTAIDALRGLRHRNVIQVYGWCREKGNLVLVYEYMANGSLDRWLFSSKGDKSLEMPWNLRQNILIGVAAALDYLHGQQMQCMLHRDITAGNVLLDVNFNAFLGDFGLAGLVDHDAVPKSTLVAGKFGYRAPELPYTGKATKNSDVYSYGVVDIEVASDRERFDRPDFAMAIVKYVWHAREDGVLFDVADPRLQSNFNTDQLERVLSLGLLYCSPDPDARPSMRFVHQCLIQEATLPPLSCTSPRFGGDSELAYYP